VFIKAGILARASLELACLHIESATMKTTSIPDIGQNFAAIEQVQSTAIDLALKFGPKLVVAGLILLAGHFVGRWVGKMMEGLLLKLELDLTVSILLVRLARVVVLGLFAVLALQNLGVELLPLIAGLGVAGAGLALAMQGVLSNLAAGLTIIFTRPFRVGEYVSIVGVEGQVDTIGLFNTILSHPDQSRVVVPNRKIAGEIMHNYGQVRQVNLSVGVAYDTDLSAALARIEALLAANPEVLRDPAPLVQIATLADSSVNIGVRPWVSVEAYPTAAGGINKAILDSFREAGITIPFPQREVRLIGRVESCRPT
jgi:small conductance mechanosensitive channel